VATKLVDDLGRTLVFVRPPQRIVSLVPSDTYSVTALGAGDRLVGRTRFCEHAADVPIVGGTKDVDVDSVLALAPDLVLGNQEENSRKPLEALAGRVPVLVSLPRTVEHGIAHLARLARILAAAGEGPSAGARKVVRAGYEVARARPNGRRAFVPIWIDPWMTINADTFGSDVLAYAGLANAFGDRLRLYPLAADLGKAPAGDAGERDVRYPRVTLDEVRARAPDVIVLPDEPYAFSEDEAGVLRDAVPTARIVRVSGKDLFWYGAWTVDALPRLAAAFA
jgi:ABC-type Fe3+-hydroxamate transport system substrate-binding protein